MILEMSNIQKGFDGLEVLKDISFGVDSGEVVSIIGPSGSGKSTLLRCATFLETIDGGEIMYMGEKAAWTDAQTSKAVYAGPQEMKKFSYINLLILNSDLHIQLKRHLNSMLTRASPPCHIIAEILIITISKNSSPEQICHRLQTNMI